MDESLVMSTEQSAARPRSEGRRFSVSPPLLVGAGAMLVVLALIAFDGLGMAPGGVALAAIDAVTVLGHRFAARRDEAGESGQQSDGGVSAIERFAGILTDPCLIIDERADLVYRNTAALEQFPRARLGDPLAFTLRDPDLVSAIETAIRTGQPQRCELHFAAPNDTWFRVSVMPYVPEGGTRRFMVITLYDLTEQKRVDRMRTDFIANASHELRTPLTSLMGFIDTLRGPAARDEAARERFLGIMAGQAERMSGLIEDLLSLTRIELRQHMRPTTPVDLALLAREVADTLEPRLRDTGIVLDLNIPSEPVVIAGDRQEVFEVIENLVDNAIKYGGSGGRVEIALVPGANRTGDHHAITVIDFGAGIAEEHVPRLTERFYRVDADSSRKKKGTGLGLAIVKHIVARHHGQLAIKSAPGKGTEVSVLFPALLS